MIRASVFACFSWVFTRLFGTRVARAIWTVPGARPAYRWIMSSLRPDEVQVRGHTVRLDPLDSLLLSVNGSYESDELDLLRDCARPGDVVLDIGAHIGLHTLELARATGPTGRVFSFEPSAVNYELLVLNVAVNGYPYVRTVQAAVSDSAGPMTLVLSADNTGDHQLRSGSPSPDESAGQNVEAVTIDGFLAAAAVDRVDIIKMDIQGSEPAALRGAADVIASSPDVLLFTEMSPDHLAASGGIAPFAAALDAAGFTLHQIESGRVLRRSVAELAGLETASDTDHADLVCTKGPRALERLELALRSRDDAVSG